MPESNNSKPDYFTSIALHEVIGGKPNLVPYKDSKGIWTIGYGHKILPEEKFTKLTPQQAKDLFYTDVKSKEDYVRKDLGEELWGELPNKAKENIVGFDYWGYYRLSPKAVGHLKNRKYYAFADEIINNKDYKESQKTGSGIAPRFDNYIQPFVDLGNAKFLDMSFKEVVDERTRLLGL